MSRYLTEAFKSMNIIDEDVFSVTPDNLKKLDQFLDGDTDVESELIIDPDAETEEELQDSYIGKVILNCPVCESKIYKDIDSIDIDDESDLVNIEEECPYCQSVGGFEIVGQVEEFKADDAESDTVEEGLLDPVKNIASKLPGVGNLIGESEESDTEMNEGLLDPVKNVAKNIPGVGNLIGESEEEDPIDEGVGGALVGGVLGGALGGVPGAVAGAAGGHFLQKNLKKEDISRSRIAHRRAKKESLLDPVKNIAKNLPGVGNLIGEDKENKRNFVKKNNIKEDTIRNAMKPKKEAIDTENKSIKDISEDASTLMGAGAGAATGAAAGAALGSAVPGIGTAIGAGLGTVAGGLAGAGLGKSMSKINQHVRDKQTNKAIKSIDKADAAVSNLKNKVGLKTEDFKRVNIETDDSIMSMDSDETGKVVVTTEPKAKRSGEMIAPVSDETKNKIIGKNTQPEDDNEVVDLEIDEFDEAESEEVVESYLKKVYENVDSYKITRGRIQDNKMIFEGVISFKSGKKSKTSFIFESQTTTKTGKVKFTGQNPQISKNKKAFTLTGKVQNGKMMTESFTYNYLGKDSKTNKSQKVYGTISAHK